MLLLFFSNLRQNLSKNVVKSSDVKLNETPVQWFSGSYRQTERQTDGHDENNKQTEGIFRCQSAKDKWLCNNSTTRNNNNNNVECKNKGDTSNNRGDWDYFKVI